MPSLTSHLLDPLQVFTHFLLIDTFGSLSTLLVDPLSSIQCLSFTLFLLSSKLFSTGWYETPLSVCSGLMSSRFL